MEPETPRYVESMYLYTIISLLCRSRARCVTPPSMELHQGAETDELSLWESLMPIGQANISLWFAVKFHIINYKRQTKTKYGGGWWGGCVNIHVNTNPVTEQTEHIPTRNIWQMKIFRKWNLIIDCQHSPRLCHHITSHRLTDQQYKAWLEQRIGGDKLWCWE